MTPILLLIHGWGFDPTFWAPFQAALPELASETVDLGYFGPFRFPEIQGPVILVGHSTGALLALHALPPSRDHTALVAINGFDHFVAVPGAIGVSVRLLDRMIARLPRDPVGTVADFRRRCGDESSFGEPDPVRLGKHLALLRTADLRQKSAIVNVPLLHLSGGCDPILPGAMRSGAFAGARGLIRAEEPTGGHLLPLSHPQWCAAQVRAMIEAL